MTLLLLLFNTTRTTSGPPRTLLLLLFNTTRTTSGPPSTRASRMTPEICPTRRGLRGGLCERPGRVIRDSHSKYVSKGLKFSPAVDV